MNNLEELEKKYNETYITDALKQLPEAKVLKLEIDYLKKVIDNYTYEKQLFLLTGLTIDKKENELKLLEIEKKYNKIDEIEYLKRYYDLHNIAWRKIFDNFDVNNKDSVFGLQLSVEYNDTFIKELRKKGFVGQTNDDVIAHWMNFTYALDIEQFTPETFEEVEVAKNK